MGRGLTGLGSLGAEGTGFGFGSSSCIASPPSAPGGLRWYYARPGDGGTEQNVWLGLFPECRFCALAQEWAGRIGRQKARPLHHERTPLVAHSRDANGAKCKRCTHPGPFPGIKKNLPNALFFRKGLFHKREPRTKFRLALFAPPTKLAGKHSIPRQYVHRYPREPTAAVEILVTG